METIFTKSYEEFINEEFFEDVYTMHIVYNVGDKVVLATNIGGETFVYSVHFDLLYEEGLIATDLVGCLITFRGEHDGKEFTDIHDVRVYCDCTERAINKKLRQELIKECKEILSKEEGD